VVVAVEPANCCLVDELIAASADGAGARHGAEAASRPGPRVTRVPCDYHAFLAADHLREGAVAGLVRDWGGAELVRGGGMSMLLWNHSFMPRRPRVGCTIHSPVPRVVAFPAP
jgi:hypothetical protein